MSEDFIEDAIESLDQGKCSYILIACAEGSSRVHKAAQIVPGPEYGDLKRHALMFLDELQSLIGKDVQKFLKAVDLVEADDEIDEQLGEDDGEEDSNP